jgi:two-component system, NarL family, invasion response regulator UvrY
MATVLIVDDHPLVRQMLREALTVDSLISQVGEARNGVEALAQASAQQWDVVILDISMPGENGVQVLKRLKHRWPTTHVIMYSLHAHANIVRMCLRAGASGYLTKGSASEELMQAIRKILAGEVVLSRAIAGVIQDESDRAPTHDIDDFENIS